jgi:hypothetical protein
MPEEPQWEYRVQTFGSTFSRPKDGDLESVLNTWGEEGWEVAGVLLHDNSGKVSLVAKRRLTSAIRRRRSWPGES